MRVGGETFLGDLHSGFNWTKPTCFPSSTETAAAYSGAQQDLTFLLYHKAISLFNKSFQCQYSFLGLEGYWDDPYESWRELKTLPEKIIQVLFKDVIYMHSSALHCRISYLFNLIVKSVPIQLPGHMQPLIKTSYFKAKCSVCWIEKECLLTQAQKCPNPSGRSWKHQEPESHSMAGLPPGGPCSLRSLISPMLLTWPPQEEAASQATQISSISIW